MQSAPAATPSAVRAPHVRAANRAGVLRLLRRYRRLSRAEIARRSGLSEAAVSRIVAGLLADEVVVEGGGEDATGGRPAIRLELNDARFQAAGIEIRNWETRISLGTISGAILETRRYRTPPSPEQTLALIASELPASAAAFAGAGVSARGLVNSDTGVAELGSDPAWIHIAVKELLETRLHAPVFLENDVRAAALAEYNYGSPEVQGSRCLLLVKVDEGIGMGIVLDGAVYRGPRMAAGEFGQMVIAHTASEERHNRPGCLELLASNDATCERYRALSGAKTRGSAGDSADQIKRICHLAVSGNDPARRAIVETAKYLGIAIANAVWALDADAVVIDGAITEAWPLVSAAIREQFPDGRRYLNFRNLMLRPSALAGEATLIGAITLPFAGMFTG
jgi:predicted NBD/HSP70 family sugar kinase